MKKREEHCSTKNFNFVNATIVLALIGYILPFMAYSQCPHTILANPVNATVCEGQSVTLSTTGGVTYEWQKDGVVIPSATTSSYIANVSGNYTVTSNVCPNYSAAIQVVVKPKPVAGFQVPGATCASSAVTFTNTTPGTGLTYSWNFGDPSSGTSNISSLKNPSHIFLTDVIGCGTKNFSVTLIVTNSDGCTSSLVQSVAIYKIPDATLITPGLNKPFTQCSDQTTFNMPVTYSPAVGGCTNTLYQISWGDETPAGTFSWSGSTPPNNLIHTYTTQGTWQLLFKVTGGNGCVTQKTYNVFNGSNPSISFGSPGSTNGCVPYTVNFPISGYLTNAEGTYYIFDYGDGSITDPIYNLSGITIPHTYNLPSCGNMPIGNILNTYTAKATAINSCNLVGTSVYVSNIAVSKNPSVSIINNTIGNKGCVNQPINFSYTANNGCQVDPSGQSSNKINVTWDFGDGTVKNFYYIFYTNLTPSFYSHTYTTPGTKIITLTIANQLGGCGNSVTTQEVCINTVPSNGSVSFNINSASGCRPFTVITTNTSTLPDNCSNRQYQWTVTPLSSTCGTTGSANIIGGANSTSPSIEFNYPGNYRITLTGSNNCSSAQYTKDITVRDKPTVTINPLTPICAGLSINPSATINNCSDPSSTYAWTFPGGSPSTSNSPNPTVNYSTAGTYPVGLTATNSCGSTSASPVNLVVTPRPSPTITGPAAACVNSTSNVYTTQTGKTGYTWSVSSGGTITSGGTSTSNTVTVTWNTVGAQTVSVNYTDGGCSAISPTVYNVTVNALPTPTISGTQKVCAGTVGNVYTTQASMSSYTWTVSSGGTITNGTGTNSITVTWHTAGSQSVSVNYMNGIGCTAASPTNWNVTVDPLPVPSITGQPSVCAGTPNVTYTTASGMTMYTWTISPGGTITAGGGTSNNSVTVTWNTAGAQYVKVNYTDANGCTATTPTNYTVTVKAVPVGTANPATQDICSGITTNLINFSSTVSGTIYNWSGTHTGGSVTGYTMSGTTSNIPAKDGIQNSGVTTGTITYSISPTADGCTGSPFTATINVKPLPIAIATPSFQSICSGEATTAIGLTSNINPATFSYFGIPNVGILNTLPPGSGNTLAIHNPTNSLLTTEYVTYSITPTANSCSGNPITARIDVKPKPGITNIVLTKTICSGQGTAINLTADVASTTFQWTATLQSGSATGFSNDIGSAINQTLQNTGTIQAIVKYTVTPTADGCSGTPKDFTVTIQPVPNVSFSLSTQTICAGTASSPITLTTNVTGVTVNYTWTGTASHPAQITGFTSSGSSSTIQGNNIQSTLTTLGSVTYNVIPNISGCNYTTPFNAIILVNPSPSVTNTLAPVSICSGGTTTQVNLEGNVSGTTFTWTAAANPPIGISVFQTSGTATIPAQTIHNSGNTPGIVTYTIVPSAGAGMSCPGAPKDYVVTVNPLINATGDNLSQVLCSGQNTTAINLSSNVSGTTYSWTASSSPWISGAANGSSNSAIAPQTLSNTGLDDGTATYSIIPSFGNCPGNTIIANVTVKPVATITNSTTTFSLCSAVSTNISLSSNVSSGVTYSWEAQLMSGTATGFSSQSTPSSINIISQTITNTGSVNAVIRYRAYAYSGNCPGPSKDFTVTVKPIPTVTTSPVIYDVCSGSSTNIILASLVTGTQYTWLQNSSPSVTGASANVTPSAGPITQTLTNPEQTQGTVTYTVTPSANGCTGPNKVITVNVNPLPIVNAGINQTIPHGTSTGLTGTASGGTGILSYVWTPPGFIASGGTTLTPITSNIYSNTTFTLQATDTKGCFNTAQTLVNVSGTALAVTCNASPNVVCNYGTTIQLGVTATGGNGTYTYLWTSVPAGSPAWSSTLQNPTVTPTVTTIYTVVVNDGFNNAPCSTNVTVNPLPAIFSVGGGGEYCAGGAGLAVTLPGSQTGVNYQLFKDGNPEGTPVAGTGNPITFGLKTAVGTYTVKATNAATACESTMTGSTTISINPLPSANAGVDKTIPWGISTTLTGTAGGGTGALNYLWTPGGMIASGGTTLTPTTTNLYINTPYTLTVTDSKGCQATGQMTVTIGGDPLSAQCNTTPAVICNNGASVQLSATPGGGSGTYTYLWTSVPAGTPVWSSTLQNPTVTPMATTIYTVVINDGYNNAPCSTTVTVNPLPSVFNVTGGGEYCSGGSGKQIGLSGSQNGITYELYLNGLPELPIVPGTGSAISFGFKTLAGSYTVKATNTTTTCINDMSGSVVISINPLPVAFAGNDQTIPHGTSTSINGTASAGTPVYTYLWTPSGMIASGATTLTPNTTNIYSNTLYTLIVTDSKGCTASDQVEIIPGGDPMAVSCNATPGVICNTGVSVQLNANASGGSGAFNYTWTSVPAGSPVWTSNLMNPVVNPTVSTQYNLVVSDGFNAVNCSTNVVVNPLPTVFNITGGGEYCSGGPGKEIFLSGSQNGISYQLYRDGLLDGSPITGTGSLLSFGFKTQAGAYTAKATNTLTTCVNDMSGTVSVIINPLPVVFAGNDFTVPHGTSTLLNATATAGTEPFILSWTPVLMINGVSNTLSVNTKNIYNPTVFTFTTVDIKGCSASDDIEVSPAGDPLAITCNTIPSVICNTGVSVLLNSEGTGGSGGPYTYSWTSVPAGAPIWTSTLQNPTVNPTVNTQYTVVVWDGYNSKSCSTSVVVNPLPVVQNVTGGGGYCAGGLGLPVGLSGSTSNIEYQLYRDGATVGTPVSGTGGLLPFGNQIIAGIYTVVATNPVTLCTIAMNGNATIVVNPLPTAFLVTGGGAYPSGGVGKPVGLANSQTGVDYTLYNNGNLLTPLPGLAGTGFPISFGNQTLEGVYKVLATVSSTGCTRLMTDSVIIVINPYPNVFNVVGGGDICLGEAGKQIGLEITEVGVRYVLYHNSDSIGNYVGSGSPMMFGNFNITGIYTVEGVNLSNGLRRWMNGNATIVVHPLPDIYTLVPSGMQCPNTILYMNGSKIGINYVLYRDNVIVATVPGTGLWTLLPLGIQTLPGSYKVKAVNITTGCTQMMNGTTTITPSPLVYNLMPAGILCEGETVWINNSQPGIMYQLRRDETVNVGAPLLGTGTSLSFGPQYYPGTYKVLAINPLTMCSIFMSDSAVLYPTPIVYSMLPVGNACSPVEITLNGSQTGYYYSLYLNNNFPPIATLIGTGLPISFGIRTLSGVYTIKASNGLTLCESLMGGSLNVNPSPIIYDIVPSGNICAGSSITIENSQLGVVYQLIRNDSIIMGAAIPGTGTLMVFGPLVLPGKYTIKAKFPNTACSEIMNGFAMLLANPVVYNITPAGNHCSGQAIGLNGSELNVEYRLIHNNQVSIPLAILNGTGSSLSFGPQSLSGTYRVMAYINGSTCYGWAADSVIINPRPVTFNVIPTGVNCEPSVVSIDGSEIGVQYQLLKNGLPLNPNIVINGTGSPVSFGTQNAGIFTVKAKTILTNCEAFMNGSASISPLPIVSAGTDATICANGIYTPAATALGYSNLLWTTTGNGTFNFPAVLNPVYTPGTIDIANGSVQLILRANGTSECPATQARDTMLLSFHPIPVSNAGSDIMACAGAQVALNGSSINGGNVFWYTTGDGVFSNPTIQNPMYTPGTADTTNRFVKLIFRVYGTNYCSSDFASDTLDVIFQQMPVISAGNDTLVCASGPVSLTGSAINFSSVLWTSRGDGTFINANTLSPTYFPGTNDTITGSVWLIINVSGISSCNATNISDSLLMSFHSVPFVSAGSDIITCFSSIEIPVSGVVRNSSGVNWTTAGSGTFEDINAISTKYFPSAGDKQNGIVELTLTCFGSSACITTSVSDNVNISFDPLPVSYAGPDTNTCSNASLSLNGSFQNATGVNWQTTGDGVFNNTAILNPVYFPGTNDKTTGHVKLVMTAFGSLTCSNEIHRDTMELNIRPLPTSILTGSGTVCAGNSAQLNVLLTGTPPWSISYTDGLDVFTINNILQTPFEFLTYPQVTCSYTVTSLNDKYCTGTEMYGSALIYVNPKPDNYTVTTNGGGYFCEGAQGVEISLNGSQTGIAYSLILAGQVIGSPLPGTGLPISFGIHSIPGLYTVIATNTTTLCTATMSGSAHLIMRPKPDVDFTNSGGCTNSPVIFTISGPSTTSIVQWIWNFGDGSNATYYSAVNPQHTYLTHGTFIVTLTATDNYGCQRTVTHPVNVLQLPVALFSWSMPVCLGDPVVFNNLSYSTTSAYISMWKWEFGDGSDTTIQWPGNPNISHIYASAGIYNAKLTITNSDGCSNDVTRIVSISPKPVANFSYGASCQNQAVAFTNLSQPGGTGTVIEWYWNFGDPLSGPANVSTLQHPVHIYQNPGVYTVILSIYSSNGCTDQISKIISIDPEPVASFTASSVCNGNPTIFTDQSVSNAGAISAWLWNFGDGSPVINIQNPSHLYSAPGVFNVSLTITTITGCVNTVILPVTVYQNPTAAFTYTSQNCTQTDISFTSQSSTSVGYINEWRWTFGDGNSTTVVFPNSPSVQHSYATPGTYAATLTVVTNLGCESSVLHNITIQNGPVANFNFSTTNCQNQSVQFTDMTQINGGGPIVTWSWNFNDPLSGINNVSNQQNPTHIFSQPGVYEVSMIATSTLGCQSEIIKTVTINAGPTALFTADTVCLGSVTQFNDLSVANTGLIVTWNWNFGDGTPSSNLANPTHLYASPSTYTVQLTVTNSLGCIASVQMPVYVRPNPTAAYTVSTQNCAGAPVQFFNQSTASQGYIVKWKWLFGDGTSTTVLFPNPPNVSHVYQNAGNYPATLTITTNDSCTSSVTQIISVLNKPSANFTSGSTNCVDIAILFTDISQLNGSGPIVSWNWDFGDPGSGVLNLSTLQNPLHIFNNSGTYDVKLVVSNINGCTDTIVKQISINPAPVAMFTADSTCLGNVTQFNNVSLPNASGIISWNWSFGDGSYSTVQNPIHTYNNWGVYDVTLAIINTNNCQHDTTIQVFVAPRPTAAFSYNGSCAETNTQFTDLSSSSSSSVTAWLWSFGDGDSSILQNPVHQYLTGGSYLVTLTVTNTYGCTNTLSQTVHIFNAPTAEFVSYSSFCPAGQVTFQDLSSGNGTAITQRLWMFGDGFFSYSANPVYTYLYQDSCYNVQLIVSNSFGCSDTLTKPVCVKPGFKFAITTDAGCAGHVSSFSPVNLAAGDSLMFVRWSFGDPASGFANISNLYNPTHVFVNPGQYFVKLKAWNSNNCVDSTYIELNITPGPISDFSWDNVPHCDSSVTFMNESIAYGIIIDSLVWNFGDGITVVQQKPIPANITHKFPAYGLYTVSLEAFVSNGCQHFVQKQLMVKCLTTDYLVLDTIHCQNAPISFNDYSAPSELISSWLWLFGDGQYSQYYSYTPVVNHTYDVPGTYGVKLVTTAMINGQPVMDSITKSIHISRAPQAVFTSSALCLNDTVTFTDQSTNIGSPVQSWKWMFGDGSTSVQQNPWHIYTGETAYQVKLIVKNSAYCTDTATSDIQLNLPPVVMLSPKSGLFCGTDTDVVFSDTSGFLYPEYRWDWGDGTWKTTSVGTASHYYSAGNYDVQLTVLDGNNCRSSDMASIRVKQKPYADFIADPHEASILEPKIYFLDRSSFTGSPIVSWRWDFGDGEDTIMQNPIYMYADTGMFNVSLYATNLDGCTDVISKQVRITPELIFNIPNAFTPNGDYLNNTFRPLAKYELPGSYNFQIYNRNGQLIFETNSTSEGWDGKYKGKDAPVATYLWVISLRQPNGKKIIHKGRVTLIR